MSTVPSGTRFIGIAESVNLTERKSAVLNTETQPYTIQDIADTVGVGAQGPQGVQGPAGPLGPVGPAGLNWQGAWVSGTSYVADDAVGYGGASYFCILATSGTTTPNLATTNWALLASQGAQGIQGVQGPTGAQGAAGGAGTLQQTVDNGNVIADAFGSTQTVYANINRFDNTFDGTFGIYGLGLFNKSDGTNSQNIELPETLIGGIKTIFFPNASGTVALTSDITGAQVTKSVKVTLTPLQVQSLFTTPVKVIDCAVGKAVLPIQMLNVADNPTAGYFPSGGNIALRYENLSTNILTGATTLGNFGPGEVYSISVTSTSSGGFSRNGEDVYVKLLSADPVGGDGGLVLYITYSEITL